ncbi:glycoside hydrolase family 2 TIM barrel-domain containing protein [Streptomyces sp. NPDC096311]|uniref:glycoside hydrolase family 2 TIM barrel-domain containing protein n=1 Tax=Streptomyces sp. NPDC096311 TaxID=3366083 RepID=UPI00381A4413
MMNEGTGQSEETGTAARRAGSSVTRRRVLEGGAGAATLAMMGATRAAADVHGEATRQGGPRREQSFDEGWRFHRGDVGGAHRPSFDDSAWRTLDLPHDWRIEDLPGATSDDGGATADPATFAFVTSPSPDGEPPERIGPFDVGADPEPDADLTYPGIGHILFPGGRSQGYTVAGVGWYRKHFAGPEADGPRHVELYFDGVCANADVWLNGVHLGSHPNGSTSFAHDLTPHLDPRGANVVAVRVDNRGKTSRWYSGSGINRHTRLTVTGPVRIPLWGVHVTTPVVDARRSVVRVEVRAVNSGTPVKASARLTVLDARGRTVVTSSTAVKAVDDDAPQALVAELTVSGAELWSPERPNLYRVRAEILVADRTVDAVTTTFGIRSLVFDGTAGFLLNGKPYKVRGGNVHHDHGPLGAVAFARAEERKIEILKAAAFNAVRAAHNPRSTAMLDACDRLGMLVLNEFTDMWDVPKLLPDDYSQYFTQWWERDLTAMLLRDRNHPGVVIWSIGNEIGAVPDPHDYGPRLAALVHSLDPTRPVSLGGMNPPPSGGDPWRYVDIGDYHYQAPTAADHAAHPDKAFLQSEDTSSDIYNDWQIARDNAWYVGSWVWTAWDYIGESGGGATLVAHSRAEADDRRLDSSIGKIPYPWFVNFQGDIDLIGQRKPQNHWRSVVNGLSPLEMMVERPTPQGTRQYHVRSCYYDELPSWTWDVPEGKDMVVRVYTAGDHVTLLLDGRRIAARSVTEADQRRVAFDVPYRQGTLTAVARRDGHEIGRRTLTTTGEPAGLRLTSDVHSLTTGRGDLAHVLVEVVDAHGRPVPDAVVKVSFRVEGAGDLVAAGNGNPHNVDSFRRPRHWTWHGKALVVLRSAKEPGEVMLTATAEGLEPAVLRLGVLTARSSLSPLG